jgi:hypothetical protein
MAGTSSSSFMVGLELKELLIRIFKYFLEGLVVAFAAYSLPGKKPDVDEVVIIGLIAAATFAVLDLFAPAVGQSVRQGAGFGIGANLVGFPAGMNQVPRV